MRGAACDRGAGGFDTSTSKNDASQSLSKKMSRTLESTPQVVLEVIEEQVARGSRIYESGHFVVLVWGNSQRDLEAVERILSQARCTSLCSHIQ